ncbi:MAG: hypothetical protein HZY76_14490 [Anaerolineae bacterium]|nr:MAG: hypothetical protein HZY76_14490 [Anaerolineae bacterium]
MVGNLQVDLAQRRAKVMSTQPPRPAASRRWWVSRANWPTAALKASTGGNT